MNAEARRLGLKDTVYRTPHGLDEPGAHSSARDVLKLARLDMASPIFSGLARPEHRLDPRPPPADEQHAARRLRGPRRRQDRPHRRGRLEPRRERRSRRRAPLRDPARRARRGDPRSRDRAPPRLGLRPLQARAPRARRAVVRQRRHGARRRLEGPRGDARSRRAGARARRPAGPARSPGRGGRAARLRRADAAAAACSGACRWWPIARGGGPPALVPWLRSRLRELP